MATPKDPSFPNMLNLELAILSHLFGIARKEWRLESKWKLPQRKKNKSYIWFTEPKHFRNNSLRVNFSDVRRLTKQYFHVFLRKCLPIAILEVSERCETILRRKCFPEHCTGRADTFFQRHTASDHLGNVHIVFLCSTFQNDLELGGHQIIHRGHWKFVAIGYQGGTDPTEVDTSEHGYFDMIFVDGISRSERILGCLYHLSMFEERHFPEKRTFIGIAVVNRSKSKDRLCPSCNAMAVPPYSVKPIFAAGFSNDQTSR